MIGSDNNRFPAPFSRNGGDASAASVARRSIDAFRGFGGAERPPIIIDGIAREADEPASAASDDGKSQQERARGARGLGRGRSRWSRRLGIAAALVFGLGAGSGGALLLARSNDDDRALIAANAELHRRVAALEHAHAGQDALAEIKAEARKDRAATTGQLGQVATRLDKMEHDMSARLQAVEKSLAPRDATASIRALPTPAPVPAPLLAPTAGAKTSAKPRVPLGGWILREVRDGGALVEGASGLRKVSPGDTLPGAGRVQRVERRGGQWVLVTAAGLIDMDEY